MILNNDDTIKILVARPDQIENAIFPMGRQENKTWCTIRDAWLGNIGRECIITITVIRYYLLQTIRRMIV